MKHYLLIWLCALFALPSAAGEFTFTYEGQTLNYFGDPTSGTASVWCEDLEITGEVIIPAVVVAMGRSYTVTTIAHFNNCTGITSVTIPNTVTYVGSFKGCTSLSSVSIPSSVTVITSDAFAECPALSRVEFDSIEALCNIEFRSSPSSNPLYSAHRLYIGGKEIVDLVIPETVTYIRRFAFAGCDMLSVTIPNSVTEIGGGAFCECNNLIELTIPDSVTEYAGWIISDCSALKHLTLGNRYVFEQFGNCENLSSVVFTPSVTSIRDFEAYGCPNFKKFAYPNVIQPPTDISLEYVRKIPYDPEGVIIEDGFVFGPDKTILYFAPSTLTGAYTVPETVETIASYAFSNCTGLTSVTIPSSVKEIGDRAFENCIALVSVSLPNSLTSMGECIFIDCINLKDVNLPESLKALSTGTFAGCKSLTLIIIPDEVETIGDFAFQQSGLSSITFGSSVTTIGQYAFRDCFGITSLQIPSPVSTIGEAAFCGCLGLTSVTFDNSVMSFGDAAFCDTGLKSVTIGKNISYIGPQAFSSCSELKRIEVDPANAHFASQNGVLLTKDLSELVQYPAGNEGEYTIPSYVKTIGEAAFDGCSKLTAVNIPSSVTSIKNAAFMECRGLKEITIPNSVTLIDTWTFLFCTSLKTVTLPESLTEIGLAAFNSCKSLTSISLPSSLQVIGDEAFCASGLTEVTIPNSVRSIGEYAFYHCPDLKTVKLPNMLESLGAYAFYESDSLSEIYYDTSNPVTANVNCFLSSTYSSATLFVPENTEAIFTRINPWKRFSKIKAYTFTSGIDAPVEDISQNAPVEIYDLRGNKVGASVDNLPAGVYVVKQGRNVKKIAVQ